MIAPIWWKIGININVSWKICNYRENNIIEFDIESLVFSLYLLGNKYHGKIYFFNNFTRHLFGPIEGTPPFTLTQQKLLLQEMTMIKSIISFLWLKLIFWISSIILIINYKSTQNSHKAFMINGMLVPVYVVWGYKQEMNI